MVFWLHQVSYWYGWAWSASALVCFVSKHRSDLGQLTRVASRFIGETKPFYFVFVGIYYITLSLMGKFHWYTSLSFLIDVYLYYLTKDYGDDDHWKKRLEKLSEKVSVSEGKLVIVSNN